MKNRTRNFIATAAILLSLGAGVTACSGPDKAAEASATASAQALQSTDARSTLESFFVSVKADSVSAAKKSEGDFKNHYELSLEYVSDSMSDEEAESLVNEVKAIFVANPTATIRVGEDVSKLDGDKTVFNIAELSIFTEDGASVPAPEDKGSITVAPVDGKPLIVSYSGE